MEESHDLSPSRFAPGLVYFPAQTNERKGRKKTIGETKRHATCHKTFRQFPTRFDEEDFPMG